MKPRLLDLFCGIGGWSRAFSARGWECTGVDLEALGYPWEFKRCDVRDLDLSWINSFDAVVMSPPCDDFARAWLPWLRGDQTPSRGALDLLQWSIALAGERPCRIVECSRFAARHAGGGVRSGSQVLWGDVPLLLPETPREKMKHPGQRPDLRAAIPFELSACVERHFRAQIGAARGA